MEGYRKISDAGKGQILPVPFPPRLATLVEGRVDQRRYGGHLCLPIAAGDMNQRVLPFYEPEARGRAKSRAWSGKVLRIESEWKSASKDPCLLQLLGLGRDSEENILERLPQREFRTEVPGPLMQKSLGRRAPWGPDRSSIPRRQLHPEKALKRFCWEACSCPPRGLPGQALSSHTLRPGKSHSVSSWELNFSTSLLIFVAHVIFGFVPQPSELLCSNPRCQHHLSIVIYTEVVFTSYKN